MRLKISPTAKGQSYSRRVASSCAASPADRCSESIEVAAAPHPSVLALIALAALAWAGTGMRSRFRGWSGWRATAFAAGLLLALAAVASPLDRLGADGLLTAHVAQHIVLGDLAAPLLVLGLPEPARRTLRRWLGRLAERGRGSSLVAARLLSPAGALLLWALATYVWFLPPLHRAAVPSGALHVLDHLSFLGFGLLIWLGAFDPRPTVSPRRGLFRGGLPWWARHIYAMSSRLAMLPPAIAVWLASPSTYRATRGPLPAGYTPTGDRVGAASLIVGFEMLLFALAVVLAFIFLSITTGRERERG